MFRTGRFWLLTRSTDADRQQSNLIEIYASSFSNTTKPSINKSHQ
jgi:hypothetical protein